MSALSCPVCRLSLSDAWIVLDPPPAAEPTRVCPRCTAVVRFASATPDDRQREADMRVHEDDDGAIHAADLGARTRIHRERLDMLQPHLAGRSAPADVLDVACRDGAMLRALTGQHRTRAVALETHPRWHRRAHGRGLDVRTTALEAWSTTQTFDLVLACDTLPYLAEPVRHLERVAARLRPGGLALVVVPNLLGEPADFRRDILGGPRRVNFTPRALVTACLRAGLQPVEVQADREIRVLCRPAAPTDRVVEAGPDALAVAHAVWGDDLRRGIKIALAQHGPTREVMRVVARTHRHAPTPASRAAIAVEIAAAFERRSAYDDAARWLRRSLADQPDAQVEATLAMVLQVQAALRTRGPLVQTDTLAAPTWTPEARLAC